MPSTYGGQEPFESFILYNYGDDTASPILSWLVSKDWITYHTVSIQARPGGLLTVSMDTPKGVDLAVDLDLETAGQALNYDQVMNTILLPDGPPDEAVWPLDGGRLEVDRYNDHDQASPVWFTVLDARSNTLVDYCVDIEDTSTPGDLSSDGRFAAISLRDEGPDVPHMDVTRDTVVLDLQTGRLAHLGQIKIVGWVELLEEQAP